MTTNNETMNNNEFSAAEGEVTALESAHQSAAERKNAAERALTEARAEQTRREKEYGETADDASWSRVLEARAAVDRARVLAREHAAREAVASQALNTARSVLDAQRKERELAIARADFDRWYLANRPKLEGEGFTDVLVAAVVANEALIRASAMLEAAHKNYRALRNEADERARAAGLPNAPPIPFAQEDHVRSVLGRLIAEASGKHGLESDPLKTMRQSVSVHVPVDSSVRAVYERARELVLADKVKP